MNFSAHLYLSGNNDPELMTGNFIADMIRGSDLSMYAPGVQRGIRLHRAIDRFTDTHPLTAQSRARLHGQFHKYAGVIVDVYYDHFLAANWTRYSQLPLETYAQQVYAMLEARQDLLPQRTQQMLPYMKMENWLFRYATLEGLHSIFVRMAMRTRFESKLGEAAEALQRDYRSFEQEFDAFFPDLERFSADFISKTTIQ